jgi:hypothetical protein
VNWVVFVNYFPSILICNQRGAAGKVVIIDHCNCNFFPVLLLLLLYKRVSGEIAGELHLSIRKLKKLCCSLSEALAVSSVAVE